MPGESSKAKRTSLWPATGYTLGNAHKQIKKIYIYKSKKQSAGSACPSGGGDKQCKAPVSFHSGSWYIRRHKLIDRSVGRSFRSFIRRSVHQCARVIVRQNIGSSQKVDRESEGINRFARRSTRVSGRRAKTAYTCPWPWEEVKRCGWRERYSARFLFCWRPSRDGGYPGEGS